MTGPSGSGKTTACGRLVSAGRERGLTVSGLLTVVERTDGGAARWAQDLRGGQRRLIAREVESRRTGSMRTGSLRWRFSSEGLLWGDQVLATACPTDVLVIDEVGPLELLHGSGWHRGMLLALAGRFRLAVVAVRPALVSPMLELARPLVGEAEVMTLASGIPGDSLIDRVVAEAAS